MSKSDKKVHLALIKPLHATVAPPAPEPGPEPSRLDEALKQAATVTVKTQGRVKLRLFHANAPTPKKAPCETCKSAACCKAFLVRITEEEYKSGLYDPYAVAFTDNVIQQLQSDFLLPAMMAVPNLLQTTGTQYYLEGAVNQPCPFLKDNKCSIYEDRPYVCRTYTCVDDPRITDEIRNDENY